VQNFEMQWWCRNEHDQLIPFRCVLALPDLVWAINVGKALVGELVGPNCYLETFVDFPKPTSAEPMLVEWANGTIRWGKIFERLGLKQDQVKPVYNYHIGARTDSEPLQIVGFELWDGLEPKP
jgi:hypothetical protein